MVALCALALLAAGCIRVEVDILVEDDGSGRVSMISALDPESVLGAFAELDFPADELGDSASLCDEWAADLDLSSDLPANAEVSDYNEDGFCGAQATFPLAASTDHTAALNEGNNDLADQMRLFKQGENWIFEAVLDSEELTADTADLPAGLADSLFEDASFKFIVDLPGRAIDGQNNATTVGSDGRFEWDIDLLNPPDRLFAQTEPGSGGGEGGGLNLGLILVIVAVLALLGAAAWWFLTQRNKADAGGAATLDAMTAGPGVATGAAPLGSPLPGSAGAPAAATPPPVATPPTAAPPVRPTDPSSQATVAMNPAEAAKIADDLRAETGGTAAGAAGAVTGAAGAAAGAAGAGAGEAGDLKPEFDAELNAWVVNHPTQGKLVHDPATDSWRPA